MLYTQFWTDVRELCFVRSVLIIAKWGTYPEGNLDGLFVASASYFFPTYSAPSAYMTIDIACFERHNKLTLSSIILGFL